MNKATHCYVGKREGEPGAHAACVDIPEHGKDTAKFIKDIINRGGYIERVPVEDARTLLGEWFEWDKSRRTEKLL